MPAESTRELIDQVRDYLEVPRVAVLATLRADGSPHQALVHYWLGEDELFVNGRPSRRWAVNLARDQRVTIAIPDHEDPLHWVGLSGTGRQVADGAAAARDAVALAQRYGEDPDEYRNIERVSFAITAQRVYEDPGAPAPAARPAADGLTIRDARPEDWAELWPFISKIVAAGETFSWDPEMTESQTHAIWMAPAPSRTLVAVDRAGRVVGSALIGPNHGGPGSHVANAGFIVDPDHAGRGTGRALGEAAIERARTDGYQAIQFNAVVESNVRAVGLWRSLGFRVLTTVPRAFKHPSDGYVGLHIMYLQL